VDEEVTVTRDMLKKHLLCMVAEDLQ